MKYSSDIKTNQEGNLIGINNCGETRAETETHIRRFNGRNDYQLIYVYSGSSVIYNKGEKIVASSGDVVLYRPFEAQDYLLSPALSSHTYWIHFNGPVCEGLFATLQLNDSFLIKTQQNREIEYMITQVLRHYNLKTKNYEIICSGLMQSILGLLGGENQNIGFKKGLKKPDRIAELISRLKMVPDLKINVSDAAEFCNMSKSHFTRIFKETTGISPVKFFLDIRIERAKELLTFTDLSIGEISIMSGFDDQNYFARIFKRVSGVTASEYRNAKKTLK